MGFREKSFKLALMKRYIFLILAVLVVLVSVDAATVKGGVNDRKEACITVKSPEAAYVVTSSDFDVGSVQGYYITNTDSFVFTIENRFAVTLDTDVGSILDAYKPDSQLYKGSKRTTTVLTATLKTPNRKGFRRARDGLNYGSVILGSLTT